MQSHTLRATFIGLALVLVFSFLGVSSQTVKAASSVFINEIHYDNAGADVGESVEIAGPAGTDLSGWSLELYNGSNGALYDTITLSGTILNQDDGYGTLDFATPAIQNGGPDGLALINGGSVIQFLSYEGSFTATSGTANGQTSTDILVSEASSSTVGQSLQLTGSGNEDDDFTWAASAAETFGNVNTGQDFQAPAPPDLFINEIHYDNAGTDSGEGFEIAGPAGTDLSGWSVELYNGSSGILYDTITLSGTIPNQDDGYGTFPFPLPSNGLQNGPSDGLALIFGTTVIQFLSYEGSITATSGTANGQTSTDILVSESSSTPAGDSLQLIGNGTTYTDFSWASTTIPQTFGNVNTGQDFGAFSGTALAASAACNGNDLDVTITAGDGPFNITGTGPDLPANGVSTGTTTLTGPGTWTGVTVTETAGDTESSNLGDFSCASAPSVVINEIQISTDSFDWEFFELAGIPGTDLSTLTLIGIESDFLSSTGRIDRVISLSGQTIPGDGFWLGLSPTGASTYGVSGELAIPDNSFENGTATYFLVHNFTGSSGDDLDTDDDGVLDSTPWDLVVDSLNLWDNGASDFDYGAPRIGPDGSFLPAGTYRCPDGPTGTFGSNFLNYYTPDGTPGTSNTPLCVPSIYINEIQASTASDDWEFFELQGPAGTDLSALTLIGIESDFLSSTGRIDRVISLSGQTIPGDGFWLGLSPAGATEYGITGQLSIPDNSFENGTATYFLVYNFTGSSGDDLDTDDDGVLDSTPWSAVLDSLNLRDNGASDFDYGAVRVGPDGSFLPAGTYRCPDGPTGSFGSNFLNYYTSDGTPGAANACQEIDLELTKTVNSSLAFEGSTIVYTITVENASLTQDATNVVVRDYLPSTSTQIENVVPGTCSQGSMPLVPGNTLEWTVGTLVGGASATCTITADVRTGTDGTTLNNYAEVESVSESTDRDSTPGNFTGTNYEDDADIASVSVGAPSACTDPATLISTIQGNGSASLEIGNVHTIRGIVVGDFQTSSNLSGFFLQEETGEMDGNPATSEGIFIHDGGSPAVNVNVGDLVQVTGTVAEFNQLTEITGTPTVTICGIGYSAIPTPITLPVASMDIWEQHEGMLVTIPHTLIATENYFQGQYGEVVLSVDARLDNPTNVVLPGAAAIAMQDLNNRSQIQMEDGRTASNPIPAPYIGANNTLRSGDTIPNLTGVIHYAFGDYELHPTAAVSFTRVNARPGSPPNIGGTLKVASFNVLNYFTTYGSRGAGDATEFDRQRTKIINAILELDADVLGLMEIENHVSDDAVTNLVDGLNVIAGAGTYAAVSTGPIGTDEIKVALIYKPARVSLIGAHAVLTSAVDPTFDDTKNRPVLAQTFEEIGSGERFTVAVNHLKSKGSDCTLTGDPDTGDGQGNCNLTRTAAATALANWLATDPTSSGDTDFLIIGDLNSYAMEDPITALKNAGFIDLINRFQGAGAYSYVFDGQAGYLDHALANDSLNGQITGTAPWHINADEPSALDYNNYNDPALYTTDQFRSSDHDPIVIGLALGQPLLVSISDPQDGATLTAGISTLMVQFNKQVKSDLSAGAANNLDNYLLLEAMGDGFQTDSCASAAASGVAATDAQIAINSVSYNSSTFEATLWINNGVPLPVGEYRLYICGTTSIEDLNGQVLNGGLRDETVSFSIVEARLPETGFAQGSVTSVPEQPASAAYSSSGMSLVIPRLGLETSVVGVPVNETGWNVTWLGSSAGYLEGSAFPTTAGNTVLTGHVWSANNQPGPFAELKNLQYGDRIEIEAWGQTYIYEVRETSLIYPYQIGKVMQHEEYDWLTLLTCESFRPDGNGYYYRRVVRAVLVAVE